MMRYLFFFIFHFFISAILYSQSVYTPAMERKSVNYSYLLYLPENFDADTAKEWPLIIYLHGRSACGSDLTKVRRYGLPFFLDRDLKLPAISVAPQCPEGKNWVTENWFQPFLADIKKKYVIDENRIYLTGMSLGGFGTFSLAIKYPEIFAAVAPLCGGGQPTTVCPMKNIPTWVFHGDKDTQVPIERSTEMVEAIRKCGGNPKYSILEGMPHDIHRTYGNKELYEWMFSQSKLNRTDTIRETLAEKEIKDTSNKIQVTNNDNKETKDAKSQKRRQSRKERKKAKNQNPDSEEDTPIKVEFK